MTRRQVLGTLGTLTAYATDDAETALVMSGDGERSELVEVDRLLKFGWELTPVEEDS